MQPTSKWHSKRAFVRLAVAVSLSFMLFNMFNMLRRGPYPRHPDEAFIANYAWDMVINRDPNPHFFHYGSLPIYLTSASLGAAAGIAKLRHEIISFADAPPISYPYYAHPSISYAPRFAFAIVAALALCAVGLLACALWPSYPSVLVSMIVLAFYPLFQRHAWAYVNTDIVVTCLAACGLSYLARSYDAPGLRQRALVPALFSGAALASKYNAGLLMVPFVAAILLSSPPRKAMLQLAVLGFATTLVFLICQPYALLDFDNFLFDVQAEVEHYRKGHPRHEGEPGWPMLRFHVLRIESWLGHLASALTVLGIAYGMATQRKKTLLLVAFPLASLAFMSMQRANFPRNLLPATACLVAFTGLGLVPISAALRRALSWLGSKHARFAMTEARLALCAQLMTGLVLLGVLVGYPKARTGRGFGLVDRDSRKEMTDWLAARAAGQPCHVVAAASLEINPIDVVDHCTLTTFEVNAGSTPEALAEQVAQVPSDRPVYLALPRWTEDAQRLTEVVGLLGLGKPMFEAGYLALPLARSRHSGDPKISLYAFTRDGARL
jgi:hypothetical protein